jgi:hypothetical protein
MSLAFLVYLISLLDGFANYILAIAIISGVISGFLALNRLIDCEIYSYYNEDRVAETKRKIAFTEKYGKIFIFTCLIFAFIHVMIPTQKTAYMMVGAYAAQTIAQSNGAQETGGKVLKIINQKLDGYIEDGVDAAKEQVNKEVTKTLKGSK